MAPRSRSGCGLDSIPAAFLSHAHAGALRERAHGLTGQAVDRSLGRRGVADDEGAPALRQGLEDRLQCCAEDGGFLLHDVRVNPAKGLEVLAVGSAVASNQRSSTLERKPVFTTTPPATGLPIPVRKHANVWVARWAPDEIRKS